MASKPKTRATCENKRKTVSTHCDIILKYTCMWSKEPEGNLKDNMASEGTVERIEKAQCLIMGFSFVLINYTTRLGIRLLVGYGLVRSYIQDILKL